LREQGLSIDSDIIPKRPRQERAPLSFAQQRVWFIDQLEPGSAAYNIPAAVRMKGPLQLQAMQASFDRLVSRHEILRTRFEAVEGEPMQVISDGGAAQIGVIDLSSLEAGARESELRRLLDEEASRGFDLRLGELLRVRVVRLAEQEHVLGLTMHHIIADGWSMGVVIREVGRNYEQEVSGKGEEQVELAVQYADYAVWQRQWLQDDRLLDQLNYWNRKLEHLPVLQLPTDHPRPATLSLRGEAESALFNPSLSAALRELSRSENATLYMTLLAGFKTLLHHYTAQQDIAVGSMIANRNRVELEPLIGFFINTQVLRTDLSGDPSFRQLLGRVKETVLEAHANQDVPFEKVVEALQPDRYLSGTLLFQVAFIFQSGANAQISEGESSLVLTPLIVHSRTAKSELALFITDTPGGLFATAEYSTDLFEKATVIRLLGHLEAILEQVAANPDRRLSAVSLLKEDERHQLLSKWNQTQADYPTDKCVHQVFEARVEKSPDALAVIFEGERLNYDELNRRANQLAHYLRNLGARPETLVGVCLERSVASIVSFLAVLKSGGVYLPLDPSYPAERLAFMLNDTGTSIIVTQQSLAERLSGSGACLVCLDREAELIAQQQDANLFTEVTPDHLAYVIYTSGSTGQSKGVMIGHRGLTNLAEVEARSLDVHPDDRVLQFFSFSFDASIWDMLMALIPGATLCLATQDTRVSGFDLVQLLRDSAITIATLPPSMLASISPDHLPHLRTLVATGEACTADIVARWGAGRSIFNGYGPTETTVGATLGEVPGGGQKPSVGRPFANHQVYILSKSLHLLPVGVPGEIYVGGVGLARGYLNQPELTAERFIPNSFSAEPGTRLYKTGDLGRYLPDGNIDFLGRVDYQVKIRGFRVELGEIEIVLQQHTAVHEAVVIVREDAPGDKRIVAYVVPVSEPCASGIASSDHACDEALDDQLRRKLLPELRDFLRSKLPDYMLPSAFVVMNRLPLLTNGKVDRKALPAAQLTGAQLDTDFVAPRTLIEQALAKIWAEVLGVTQAGVNDNFFEIGGHSLLTMQVITRVREVFGLDMPLRKLFEGPTIASFAQEIEQARRLEQGVLLSPISRASRAAPMPLSFAQQRLWFLDQLQPGSYAFNLPCSVALQGALDLQALRETMSEIVRRHETLRTRFEIVDEQPAQVISEARPVALPVVDISGMTNAERSREVKRLSKEELRRPFDLSKGPLMRLVLVRLSDDEHVALVTLHHIIADGWSIGVLIREVAALYSAYLSRKPSPLPELGVQYADYAVWQRDWLQGEVLQRQVQYWKQKLSSLNVLRLPTDKPRLPVQTFKGAAHPFTIPEPLAASINALSQSAGVTPFVTLLGAFQTLLYRYTAQEDIIVGTDVANRNRLEVEGLIGFFVNQLVLRGDLSGNPTFRELLARLREVCLEAYDHQDLPFEKLVEALRPERDMSRSPLFQVKLVFQNTPVQPVDLPGLKLSAVEADLGSAHLDLILFLRETQRGLSGALQYNTDLFNAATIERMVEHFQALLGSILTNPDATLKGVEMLTEAEKQRQVMEKKAREESQMKRFKAVKPKAISLSQESLVNLNSLRAGESLPLVVEPAADDLDLSGWSRRHLDFIGAQLFKHGAILFRGFAVPTVPEFEQVVLSICPQLFEENGELPRENIKGKIYSAVDYPPTKKILWHNENTFWPRWPLKIWFYCVEPASRGGETPIADSRKVLQRISPKIIERFRRLGVMYLRNCGEELGLNWQTVFQTTNKAEVESYCKKNHIEIEWKSGDRLNMRWVRPALATHPRTGEEVWFTQATHWHISCLDPEVQESFRASFSEADFPRNCYYGDGSTIESAVMEEICEVYRQQEVSFPWQKGDILMVDNMLTAHGRNPYEGPRKIAVALGEMVTDEGLDASSN